MRQIGDVELGLTPVIVGVLKRLSIQDANRAKESGADVIELRIDLLEGDERNIEKVKEFLEEQKLPVIVTNRRREEGGSFVGSEEERIAMLSRIIETAPVNAVDIEFLSHEEVKNKIIAKANNLHIPVIISFHDFNGMPRREDISNIIECMYDEGGSIAKIAVTPKSLNDALFLLKLTHEVSSVRKLLICIGMGSGSVGRHLRLIAPLYGSVLTYGHIEGEEGVAPGQFSVSELRLILDKIGTAEKL
ncbi:MAG: type I 3-dehydroquinate dehydratase [Methanosarcinales archaeon]